MPASISCPHCGRALCISAPPAPKLRKGRSPNPNRRHPASMCANFPVPLWASCELARCRTDRLDLVRPWDRGALSAHLVSLLAAAVEAQRLPAAPPPEKWFYFCGIDYAIGGVYQLDRSAPRFHLSRKYIIVDTKDIKLAEDFRALCARAQITVSAAIVRVWAYAAHGIGVHQWASVEDDIDTSRAPKIEKIEKCPICNGRGFAPLGDPAARMCPRCVPWAQEISLVLWDLLSPAEKEARKAAYFAASSDPTPPAPSDDLEDILGSDDPAPALPRTADWGDIKVIMPSTPLVEPVDPLADALAEYESQLSIKKS